VAKDWSVRVLRFGDHLSDVVQAGRTGVCGKQENEWKAMKGKGKGGETAL